MKRFAALALIATMTPLPAFAVELYGEWCAPEEPEVLIWKEGVGFVDHGCSATPSPVRTGVLLSLDCGGDSGDYKTQIMLSLSGAELSLTEGEYTTVYTRCPEQPELPE